MIVPVPLVRGGVPRGRKNRKYAPSEPLSRTMMRRTIDPKINALRGLRHGGSGVGRGIGGGIVFGCDGAGLKTLPPGVGPGRASLVHHADPPDVGVECGCEGGKGALWDVEYVGIVGPELLPVGVMGVPCAPLVDGAEDESCWGVETGGGVRGFTIGNGSEDGVAPGGRFVATIGMFSASAGSASAIALASVEALGKRAAGSFARQRVMTAVSAGGTFGLMSDGEGGVAWRCFAITAVGVSL